MSQAVPLDVVALRVPADADVLVTVRGDDEALVGAEEERGQERGVPQDERAPRRVLVRRQRVAPGLRLRWGRGRSERERVAVRGPASVLGALVRAGTVPENVPKLISDEDRLPVLRERDLRWPFRELPIGRFPDQKQLSTQKRTPRGGGKDAPFAQQPQPVDRPDPQLLVLAGRREVPSRAVDGSAPHGAGLEHAVRILVRCGGRCGVEDVARPTES